MQTIELATDPHTADTDILETVDFYATPTATYYASQDGRAFLVTLNEITLAQLDSDRLGDTEGNLDAATEDLVRSAVKIEEVSHKMLYGSQIRALDVATIAPRTRDWLFAVADAIEDAGGVPEGAIMPPSPGVQ